METKCVETKCTTLKARGLLIVVRKENYKLIRKLGKLIGGETRILASTEMSGRQQFHRVPTGVAFRIEKRFNL